MNTKLLFNILVYFTHSSGTSTSAVCCCLVTPPLCSLCYLVHPRNSVHLENKVPHSGVHNVKWLIEITGVAYYRQAQSHHASFQYGILLKTVQTMPLKWVRFRSMDAFPLPLGLVILKHFPKSTQLTITTL